MTDVQIYAGLAPLVLGVFALLIANYELRKVQRRKTGSRPSSAPLMKDSQTIVASLRSGFPFATVPMRAAGSVVVIVISGLLFASQFDAAKKLYIAFFFPHEQFEITAKDAIGTVVFDDKNKKIGEVTDFVLKPRGSAPEVVVTVDSFASTGESVTIPLGSLEWQRNQGNGSEDEPYKATAKDGLASTDKRPPN